MATDSKQPRFSRDTKPTEFYMSIMNWVNNNIENEPPYASDSRLRDTWLSDVWKLEPHLAGVINSVVSIDKNRGWTLTGGKNQVKKYIEILHTYGAAPNLEGWRFGLSAASMSFYTTDIGTIVELGKEGKNGPLRALYHVDPTRFKLTGKVSFPLEYTPENGKPQEWEPLDFFRTTSLPNINEMYNGLGYCALSRCIELTKLMVAIYEHDREQLGAKAPRGLLLLQGIDEEQWLDAMKMRTARMEGQGFEYFKSVGVIAGGSMEQIDAKLVALSNMPEGLDLQAFTNLLMYGYALCFGYDPSEFYPVQFGALGRGTEMEVQHEKATVKGKLDFSFSYQEMLQLELPPTLEYNFDERDDQGEMIQAQVESAQAGLISQMSPFITTSEARLLFAERGLIPYEWTEDDEDIEIEDTEEIDVENIESKVEVEDTDEEAVQKGNPEEEERKRQELLSHPRIRRAAEVFPDEPIVRYSYPENKTHTLADSGRALMKPKRVYYALSRTNLYQSDDFYISTDNVELAIEEGKNRLGTQFESLLLGQEPPPARTRLQMLFRKEDTYWYWNKDTYRYVDSAGNLFSHSQMRSMLTKSINLSADYVSTISEKLVNGDITRAQFKSMMKEELKAEYIRQYMLGKGGYEQMTKRDWGSIGGSLTEQYKFLDEYSSSLLRGDLSAAQVANRSTMYSNSARETYERARAKTVKQWGADEEAWHVTSGNNCEDCLDNQSQSYQEIGYFSMPGDGKTICLTNCHCYKSYRNSTTGEEYEG